MIRRVLTLGAMPRKISIIGFGAFAAGGWMWGEQDDATSLAAMHAALEHGVNWIDTAPIYGDGRADRVVGRFLRELPAERRPLVFGKFGHHLVDGQRVNRASRAAVVADCERVLRDLQVEAIDLFQLHWPCPEPVAETAAACAELLAAGKIRAIGVCNHEVAQLDAWRATGVPLHSVQNRYSLMAPQAADAVLPWCEANGVAFLAHSTLHRGLLFGKWQPGHVFPPGDHRGERPEFQGRRLERALAAVAELRALAEADGMDVAQLAIGALVCTPGLTACIVGARSPEQGAYLGELGLPATAEQLARIEDIAARMHADLAGIAAEEAAQAPAATADGTTAPSAARPAGRP
jgi:aryl-alcohol dehydrogenase-like predicted oxidoreductase